MLAESSDSVEMIEGRQQVCTITKMTHVLLSTCGWKASTHQRMCCCTGFMIGQQIVELRLDSAIDWPEAGGGVVLKIL